MLRTILIPLDGTPCSNTAAELGMRWARRSHALLVGLGIVDEPAISRPELAPLGGDAYKAHRDEVVLGRARRQVEVFLETFTLNCVRENVASKILQDVGDPQTQLLQQAQRYDLLFLSQETHFLFATQEGPCNTLAHVLKHTPRPLVMVPRSLRTGTSILVAYDGSLQAARALHAFETLGLAGTEEVHVVTVGDQQADTFAHAERARDYLHNHDRKAQRHTIVTSAHPAEVLAEQARRLDAGVIVIGAYGRPGLLEFFLGSVTRTMLETSEVPLFLYH